MDAPHAARFHSKRQRARVLRHQVPGADSETPRRQKCDDLRTTPALGHSLREGRNRGLLKRHFRNASEPPGGKSSRFPSTLQSVKQIQTLGLSGEGQLATLAEWFPEFAPMLNALRERILDRRIQWTIRHDAGGFHGVGIGHVGASHHRFEPDARMRIRSEATQNLQRKRQPISPMSRRPRREGPYFGRGRSRRLGQQRGLHRLKCRRKPNCGKPRRFPVGIVGRHPREPGAQLGNHRGGIPIRQLPEGHLAAPALARNQFIEKRPHRTSTQRFPRHQRAALRRHSPDAPVRAVPIGMTEARLIVSDDRIEPVAQIQRPVGTKSRIHNSKRGVGRFNQGRQPLGAEGRTVLGHPKSFDRVLQVATGDKLALIRRRPVAVVHHIATAKLAPLIPDRALFQEVRRRDHRLREVINTMPVARKNEGLSPPIEDIAKRIVRSHGARPKRLEPTLQRPKSPDAGVTELLDTPWSFDPRFRMQSLREQQLAGRSPSEGIDRLVSVASAEAAEENGPLIRPSIAVGVAEVLKLGAASNVDATMPPFDAAGDHQAVGKNRRTVRPSVAIAILQHDHFVLGWLPGTDLRVHRAAHHPQAAIGIEANLNRLHHALAFRRKERDVESSCHTERRAFRFRIGRIASRIDRMQPVHGQQGDHPESKARVHCREGTCPGAGILAATRRSASTISGTNCSISAGNQRIFGSR